MSRGPGRLERAIRALFDAHPDLAFVTDELCEHCYPDAKPIERKHQVAVLRAAFKVINNDPDWGGFRSASQGGAIVFYNRANVQSTAMCCEMAFYATVYRSPKRARRTMRAVDSFFFWRDMNQRLKRRKIPQHPLRAPYTWVIKDRADVLKALRPDDLKRAAKWVQEHIAKRDGNVENSGGHRSHRWPSRRCHAAYASASSRRPHPRTVDAERSGRCTRWPRRTCRRTGRRSAAGGLTERARCLVTCLNLTSVRFPAPRCFPVSGASTYGLSGGGPASAAEPASVAGWRGPRRRSPSPRRGPAGHSWSSSSALAAVTPSAPP